MTVVERYRRMNVQERLRQAIDQQQSRLRASVPPDQQAAIIALIRTLDRLPRSSDVEPPPDLITGRRLVNLGGNTALQLGFESTGGEATAVLASSGEGLDGWAECFLEECNGLAEAELVLAHCE